jgi:hypothetical protein
MEEFEISKEVLTEHEVEPVVGSEIELDIGGIKSKVQIEKIDGDKIIIKTILN